MVARALAPKKPEIRRSHVDEPPGVANTTAMPARPATLKRVPVSGTASVAAGVAVRWDSACSNRVPVRTSVATEPVSAIRSVGNAIAPKPPTIHSRALAGATLAGSSPRTSHNPTSSTALAYSHVSPRIKRCARGTASYSFGWAELWEIFSIRNQLGVKQQIYHNLRFARRWGLDDDEHCSDQGGLALMAMQELNSC